MPLQQFKSLIDNLAAINFGELQDRAISENAEALAQYQVEQWAQGKDADGNDILLEGNGYNPFYADKKRKYGIGLGAVTDRVTLFLTGELYRATFAQMEGQRVTFSSKVPYFGELMQRTGDVTGLNESNRIDFAFSFVLPFVSRELLDKTGLKIRVGASEKIF